MVSTRRIRLIPLLLVLLLTAFCAAVSQSSTAQREVEAAELERVEAIQRGDVNLLDRLYAPEYTAISPNGLVRSKAEILDEFRRAGHGFDQTNAEVKVLVYGETAVVTGRTIQQTPLSVEQSRFVRVWVKKQGRWQAVIHQSTPASARRRTPHLR